MNNAEKFKQIFGLYATELWSMPEGDFLAWLNQTAEIAQNVQDEDLISKLSEIRSEYNCFDEDEEPQYRALSEAIRILSQRADGDPISRQAAIDAILEQTVCATKRELVERCDANISDENGWLGGVCIALDTIEDLPSVQPERTCVNCGRTANNGGWYADGRTRCPIEEHYALPKDGYCHLWEKRNITDDDYPERRTDE